jgi:hypothetical protein
MPLTTLKSGRPADSSSDVSDYGIRVGSTPPPSPSNALTSLSTSQQQTTTCHDGSTPDANGNGRPPSHEQGESTNSLPSDHNR